MAEQKSGKDISRRRVLKVAVSGVVAIPLASLIGSGRASAQNLELPKLSIDDPAGKALAYHEDASKVSVTDFPSMVAGSECTNCQLYSGTPDAQWGTCSIFPGKLVAGKGWCRTWVKKA